MGWGGGAVTGGPHRGRRGAQRGGGGSGPGFGSETRRGGRRGRRGAEGGPGARRWPCALGARGPQQTLPALGRGSASRDPRLQPRPSRPQLPRAPGISPTYPHPRLRAVGAHETPRTGARPPSATCSPPAPPLCSPPHAPRSWSPPRDPPTAGSIGLPRATPGFPESPRAALKRGRFLAHPVPGDFGFPRTLGRTEFRGK